jgi:hypothetical protein
LNSLTKKGRIRKKTSVPIPKKAVKENGAWLTYRVVGGNSRYNEITLPEQMIPVSGSPRSIRLIRRDFKRNLFMEHSYKIRLNLKKKYPVRLF